MSTPDASESAPSREGLAKPLLGIALIAVALGAVAIGVAREGSKSGAADDASPPAERTQVVTVYYFHGETRCETCLAIESATERVVRERFAEELAEGTLRYEAVNYDAPAGRHFRDDYDLAFGSVVVQGIGGDRPWENLADVWSLVHDDPAKLEAYLTRRITSMLAGSG
jgi:hypothetical protein